MNLQDIFCPSSHKSNYTYGKIYIYTITITKNSEYQRTCINKRYYFMFTNYMILHFEQFRHCPERLVYFHNFSAVERQHDSKNADKICEFNDIEILSIGIFMNKNECPPAIKQMTYRFPLIFKNFDSTQII